MEAYRIDRFGSVDGIVLRSSEDPRPGPKEILMRVRTSSLNYRDLMVLRVSTAAVQRFCNARRDVPACPPSPNGPISALFPSGEIR